MYGYRLNKIADKIRFAGLMLGCALSLGACVSGGSTPSRPVDSFIFFYQPPAPTASDKSLPYSIAIERFSAPQILRSGAMLYLPERYKVDEYVFSRWRMPPAEMVSEFLRRDFIRSGRFQAVFGTGDNASVTFRVLGRVEECYESDMNGIPSAVLAFQATVFDESDRVGGKRIVFQKNYRHVEPMSNQSPSAMAESMSRAMGLLSLRLEKDIAEIRK